MVYEYVYERTRRLDRTVEVLLLASVAVALILNPWGTVHVFQKLLVYGLFVGLFIVLMIYIRFNLIGKIKKQRTYNQRLKDGDPHVILLAEAVRIQSLIAQGQNMGDEAFEFTEFASYVNRKKKLALPIYWNAFINYSKIRIS